MIVTNLDENGIILSQILHHSGVNRADGIRFSPTQANAADCGQNGSILKQDLRFGPYNDIIPSFSRRTETTAPCCDAGHLPAEQNDKEVQVQDAVFYSFEIIWAIHVFGRSDRDYLPCAIQTDRLYLIPIDLQAMAGGFRLCRSAVYAQCRSVVMLRRRSLKERERLFFIKRQTEGHRKKC